MAVLFLFYGKAEFSTMEFKSISLNEVDELMSRRDNTGAAVPFDIAWRTFSSKKKCGGGFRALERVTYKPSANPDIIKKENREQLLQPVKTAKDPDHSEHWTRNLQLPDGSVRKVYLEFIIMINEFKVRY
jgi:hypothetical protein